MITSLGSGPSCTVCSSLVLDNKVPQAINVLNNNANKSNSDFYDAYIILIIDSLKKNNFKKADEYLTQSLKFQDEDRINLVIFETLKQYIYTFKNKKILDNKKNFGNLSLIAETFQRCYIEDKRTSLKNCHECMIVTELGSSIQRVFSFCIRNTCIAFGISGD